MKTIKKTKYETWKSKTKFPSHSQLTISHYKYYFQVVVADLVMSSKENEKSGLTEKLKRLDIRSREFKYQDREGEVCKPFFFG